jgi:hypothetical protein
VSVIRRGFLGGLAAMGVVALATAVWPHVAGWVFGVLISTLIVVCAVPVTAATCWARREVASRRELRAMPVLDADASYSSSVPTLRELRESA